MIMLFYAKYSEALLRRFVVCVRFGFGCHRHCCTVVCCVFSYALIPPSAVHLRLLLCRIDSPSDGCVRTALTEQLMALGGIDFVCTGYIHAITYHLHRIQNHSSQSYLWKSFISLRMRSNKSLTRGNIQTRPEIVLVYTWIYYIVYWVTVSVSTWSSIAPTERNRFRSRKSSKQSICKSVGIEASIVA